MAENKTNQNKFSMDFIICTNDALWFLECEKYIQNLYIPDGMHIHIIPIWNDISMCHGYNIGMKQSHAKYKVYLHQDTFIIYKNFIIEILRIFQTNPCIGLIGLIGADEVKKQKLLVDSWEYGSVLVCNGLSERAVSFGTIGNLYRETDCVDGMLIATQYDILWREDIFKEWDFYDRSICMEFRKHNLLCVIPRQKQPWCIHDCGPSNLYNWVKNMTLFINTYSDYFAPETIANSMTKELSDNNLSQIRLYTDEAEKFFQKKDYQSAMETINNVIRQKQIPSKKMIDMYNLLAIGITCQTNVFFNDDDTLESMCFKYTKARFLLRRICYNIPLNSDETTFLNQLSLDERTYITRVGLTYSSK